MSALQPIFVTGMKGLVTNRKPVFLPNQAWQVLENAYAWRERVVKREGLEFIARLQRSLTAQALGSTSAGPPNTFIVTDVFTTLTLRATEPNAEIKPGSLVITVGAPDTATFTDQGDGTFAVTGAGVAAGSYVNYATGRVVLQFTALTGGSTVTANIAYYPLLAGMGIWTRDISTINDEQTIWFDQKYAYINNGTVFQEFIPGTEWNSGNANFFWGYNYQGVTAADRLFFETNFLATTDNPMRYTDGTTWTDFAPLATASTTIWTAKIIIAYYGRLLLLGTVEGPTVNGPAGGTYFFNRCRGSQLGDPTAIDAFQTDVFGKGISLDAPTNEAIISATFIKNTLVVKFEKTTWQLRYVGEYGLPFIWERVSADFGSNSTFANVLFDNTMRNIGDKAITSSNALGAERIDLDIPDQVFQVSNANNGPERVWGIRDFQRELVFWNFPDAQTATIDPNTGDSIPITFPNKVLVYNYRNDAWAIFRDSVTCFGTYQPPDATNWDSVDITWDDEDVTWNDFDTQEQFPKIVGLNQQGYAFAYGYTTPDEESLSIQDVDLSASPIELTVPNHNLQPDEIVFLDVLQFLNATTFQPITSDLNEEIYQVQIVDSNTISLYKYNFESKSYADDFSYSFDPVTADNNALYIGGGTLALFPRLNLQSKDFNPFQDKGTKTKLARIDFLMEATTSAAITVQVYINSSPAIQGNMTVGQVELSTAVPSNLYPRGSDYAWFRFFSTCQGQYFNINLTYDDALMNMLSTHEQSWTLYGINAFVKPGGKMV